MRLSTDGHSRVYEDPWDDVPFSERLLGEAVLPTGTYLALLGGDLWSFPGHSCMLDIRRHVCSHHDIYICPVFDCVLLNVYSIHYYNQGIVQMQLELSRRPNQQAGA